MNLLINGDRKGEDTDLQGKEDHVKTEAEIKVKEPVLHPPRTVKGGQQPPEGGRGSELQTLQRKPPPLTP